MGCACFGLVAVGYNSGRIIGRMPRACDKAPCCPAKRLPAAGATEASTETRQKNVGIATESMKSRIAISKPTAHSLVLGYVLCTVRCYLR